MYSCGNRGSHQAGNIQKSAPDSAGPARAAEEPRPVAADGDYLIREVRRDGMLLFGQWLETDQNQIYAGLQLLLPGVIRQISNSGGIISGPMVMLYEAPPAQTGTVRVFVGIPVKSGFKKEGETEFRNIPAGDYYRMDCNAEAGNTLQQHLKMQRLLREKNMKFQGPVLEIVSESRNDEMTVVSRAALLYLKKQH